MKKRIITLLAILALLITCAVFSVQALDGDAPAVISDFVCPCSACETVRTNDNPQYKCPAWSEWKSLPTSGTLNGHYYVNSDVGTTAQLNVSTNTAVILIDGATVKQNFTGTGNSSRMLAIGAAGKLYLIGNNGAEIQTRVNTAQGTLMQLASTDAFVTVGGDLTFNVWNQDTKVTYGGYFKCYLGELYVRDFGRADGLASDDDPVFNGASSTTGHGDCIYMCGGDVTLEAGTFNAASNSSISNITAASELKIGGTVTFVTAAGTSSRDIYRTNGKIQVDKDWCDSDATIKLYAAAIATTLNDSASGHGQLCTGGVLEWGELVGTTFTKQANSGDGVARATGITLVSADRGNPPLYRISASSYCGFVAPRAQVFADGELVGWYTRPSDAFTPYRNATGEKYLKIWGNYDTAVTIDNLYVDLNGYSGGTWTVSSGKNFYAFDSKATNSAAGKTFTATGGNVHSVTKFGDATYILVPDAENANKRTVYKVGATAAVNTVALRPSANGMYFGATATFEGLDAATSLLKTGVAVSVNPIGNTLDGTDWTADNNTTGKGVLIKNIIKDGFTVTDGTIDGRTNKEIYVEACVTYNNELVFLSDNNKVLSFDGLMGLLNSRYASLNAEQQTNTYNFYKKWAIDNVAYRTAGLWSGLTSIVEPTPAQ